MREGEYCAKPAGGDKAARAAGTCGGAFAEEIFLKRFLR